jgi:hypothetical protein
VFLVGQLGVHLVDLRQQRGDALGAAGVDRLRKRGRQAAAASRRRAAWRR